MRGAGHGKNEKYMQNFSWKTKLWKTAAREACEIYNRYLLFRLMTTDELVYNAGLPASR
jgi:hypothetical protein